MRKALSKAARDEAVSPVIAVILLLAITVVLAAVMYITVTSLITDTEPASPLGVVPTMSQDRTNWNVKIVQVSTPLNTSTVRFMVTAPNGTVSMQPTPLSQLPEFHDTDPIGLVSAGDYVLLPTATYPLYSHVLFLKGQSVLSDMELQ